MEMEFQCDANKPTFLHGKEKIKQSPRTRAQIDMESDVVYRKWVDYEMRQA